MESHVLSTAMATTHRPLRLGRAILLVLSLALSPFVVFSAPVGPRRQPAPSSLPERLAKLFQFALPISAAQVQISVSGNGTDVTFDKSEPLNVSTVPLPEEQPPQTRQQIMSFLLYNSTFTTPINEAVLQCLAVGTGTNETTDWGLWSFKRFTPDMLQIEYFCNVPDGISDGQFSRWLGDYASKDREDSGLTDCVRRKQVGFTYGYFYIGREPEEREDLEYTSVPDGGGSPSWLPGLLIGIVGLVCLVGALVIAKNEVGRKYNPSDYDDVEPDGPPPELSEQDELRMMADGR